MKFTSQRAQTRFQACVDRLQRRTDLIRGRLQRLSRLLIGARRFEIVHRFVPVLFQIVDEADAQQRLQFAFAFQLRAENLSQGGYFVLDFQQL